MELGKLFDHDIRVSPSANKGIIVDIDCARFCYSSPGEFLKALGEFFQDPKKWEKEYTSSCGQPTEDARRHGNELAPATPVKGDY